MHRTRFADMEQGLPENYQGGNLDGLRHSHEGLINEGMQLISDSYLDPLSCRATNKGIDYRSITPEGRNYTEILDTAAEIGADLLVLGAWGHGENRPLGSTAERVLTYSSAGDVLLMRNGWSFDRRPIIVGVDGSENSYSALRRATEISIIYGAEVIAVSVYDPFFHSGVFKSIASSLPDRAREHFDISSQETIHNEIIDEGLERLYRAGLDRGVRLARAQGVDLQTEVLAGKVSPEIQKYASENDIGLIIMGRWGLHREKRSLIGSNALRLARLSSASVLVVAPESEPGTHPGAWPGYVRGGQDIPWSAEAESALEHIPSFARNMARRAVESYAQDRGLSVITPEIMREVAGRFGMKR